MSDLTKERIAADLQKAKETGGARVERIRDIIQKAASEVFAEFKAGSGELGTIAKDSIITVSEESTEDAGENAEETVNASDTATSTNSKSLIATLFEAIRSQLLTQLSKGYVELKKQAMTADANLTERYGDRYESAKQRVGDAAIWYNDVAAQAAANADAEGTTVVEQKQAEFAVKAGTAGVTVAQKEQQILQQLKQFAATAVDKI